MKFLILLTLLLSINSFSKVVNPSIDSDLDYKVDADTEDQQRSLAGGDKEEKEEGDEKKEEPTKKRDLASEKDKLNDAYHDIRFWKY